MRVAVLGLAHVHVENYIAILESLPGVDLIGCAERGGLERPGPEGAAVGPRQRPSRTFAGVQTYPSAQSLLKDCPDAVIICSETSHHRELVEQAAAAGSHILCEKPIATTLTDARAMNEACQRAGVQFMTAFPMRFDATLKQTRRELQAGSLGEVLGVVGVNHSVNPSAHDAWFADPALSGGGALMDHVVHLADLYRWCFGCEIREVYAALGQTPGSSVETSGLLLMTLENGLQASIDCSWSRPGSYPRWGHLTLEIVAENGALRVDPFAEHLTLYSPSSPGPQWVGFSPDPNRAMLEAFLESAAQNTPPPVSWLDGYRALQVVLGAYASNRSGQPETLSSNLTHPHP